MGVYTGFSYSIKNNSQKGKIISIPCNSILNNYELKNLNICNSSPILHPRLNISGLFTWKQRSFVLIKKFILILDYLVPTTRICIFKKNLTSILEHGNELLIFSVYERKIVIIEHLKLRIVHSIILPFGFINIISVDNSLKNFLLILKDNTSIIVFDIRKRSSIKIVNFRKKIEISCLKGSSSLRNIFIGTISGKFFNHNEISSKNNFNYKIKEFGKIEQIIMKKNKNVIKLIFSKKFALYKKNIKSFKKILKFRGHLGDISAIYFNINQKTFVSTGRYDNSIILHKFDFGSEKLINFKKIRGFSKPIKEICYSKNLNTIFFIENEIRVLNFLDIDFRKNVLNNNKDAVRYQILLGKIFSKISSIKFIVRQIDLILDTDDESDFYVIIRFENIEELWVFEHATNILLKFSLKRLGYEAGKVLDYEICIKRNLILVSAKTNSLKVFDLKNGGCLKTIKNHSSNSKNILKCSIDSFSTDYSCRFLISGCCHGKLVLRNAKNFSKINEVFLKEKIRDISWCKATDLIIVHGKEDNVSIFFPENLTRIGKFSFHKKKITSLYVIFDPFVIISASCDKTLKIFDIEKKKCIDTIKFSSPISSFSYIKKESVLLTSHLNTIGIGILEFKKKNEFHRKFVLEEILCEEAVEEQCKCIKIKKFNKDFYFSKIYSKHEGYISICRICSLNKIIEEKRNCFKKQLIFTNINQFFQ